MKTVLALGTFDGAHLGHRAIFEGARAMAARLGAEPVIYTFEKHPLALFGKQPPLLMGEGERIGALRSTLCRVVADAFTKELASTEPEEFVKLLLSRFDMAGAVAGYNYSFGCRGAGNVALLRELGARFGFAVEVVEPVLFKGEPVSSTRIRACVEAGDVQQAGELLGRRYALSGIVVGNRRIGRTLGCPTANLSGWEGRALPAPGVYATVALTDGMAADETMPAVTNIGCNPTVDGSAITVETHILDFDGDLYGKALRVEFVERLRGEIRFPNREALAAQMALDAQNARDILKKHAF